MKWRDLTEHQIQKAKAEGQLENLKGEGKPLPRRHGGNIVSAGMAIMAEAGVLPREIQLKKEADTLREELRLTSDPAIEKDLMRKLAGVEMRLGIEQEARRKFFRTA